MQRVTANRYNQLGEVIAAAKPFYDSLSPEQKQAADRLAFAEQDGAGGERYRLAQPVEALPQVLVQFDYVIGRQRRP